MASGSGGTRAQAVPRRVPGSEFVVWAVGLATTVAAVYLAAFLSFVTCIGTESDPVGYGSARMEACDFLGMGFWGYVIVVGVVAYVSMLVLVVRRPGGVLRQLTLLVLVPAVAVQAVPLVLALIPESQ